MKLMRIDVFLMKLLFLLATGIVVFQVLGQHSITSILFYMTFPVTVVLWLRTVRSTITGMGIVMLLTIALSIINVLLDAAVNNAALNFTYIKKIIIFSMSLLFFQTAYRLQIDEEIVKFINWMVDFLTVFLIIMFCLQTKQMFLLRGRVSNYLTFRIGNPNLTGLYLTCFYMLELYRIFTPEKWYLKCIHVLKAVLLVVFVLLTQSRNCLVAVVMFSMICAWLFFQKKRNLRIGKLSAIVMAVFPILFLIAYIFLVYTPWVQNVFSFIVSEGKNLDSRMDIWGFTMQHLWNSPVIGAYHDISYGVGVSQMHNSHLDIAASYGIPVLILVCFQLYIYLHQGGRIYSDKQGFVYILGFACAILLGIGEAALFSGGLSIYIFVGAFLLMADRQEQTEIVR